MNNIGDVSDYDYKFKPAGAKSCAEYRARTGNNKKLGIFHSTRRNNAATATTSREIDVGSEWYSDFQSTNPKSVAEFQARTRQRNISIFEDSTDDSPVFMSGRGRNLKSRIIIPGEPVEQLPEDNMHITKKIREIFGPGYTNEVVKNFITNRREHDPQTKTAGNLSEDSGIISDKSDETSTTCETPDTRNSSTTENQKHSDKTAQLSNKFEQNNRPVSTTSSKSKKTKKKKFTKWSDTTNEIIEVKKTNPYDTDWFASSVHYQSNTESKKFPPLK